MFSTLKLGTSGTRLAAAMGVGLGAVLLAAASASAQSGAFTKFVAFGEALGAGDTFSGASESTIGPPPSSRVVVIALVNPGSRSAVLAGPIGGPPVVLARAGDQSPGVAAGITISVFNDAWADSAGRVLIDGLVAGTGVTSSNDNVLWLHDGANLRLIARQGSAPVSPVGIPAGVTISAFDNPSFSNSRVTFAADLAGSGVTVSNDRAILLYDGTNTTLVAREGSPSGVVAGVNWTNLGEPIINASGRIAFQATINTGASTNNEVIVSGIPGSLTTTALMFRDGAAAPLLASGVTLLGPFAEAATIANQGVSINNANEVAARVGLDGTGVTTLNDFALYTRLGATISTPLREGDVLPGFAGLPAFAPRLGDPFDVTLGGQGVLTWTTLLTGAIVTDATDRQLMRRRGTAEPFTFDAILREGVQAPGEAAGVTFGSNSPATFGLAFAVNALGHVLARTTLVGGTGTPTTIWANDPVNNTTYRVDRAGTPVTLIGAPANLGGPGPLAATFVSGTVQNLAGSQMGQPTALDDNGVIVITGIQFSVPQPGGATPLTSGVYTTNIAAPVAGACCRGATCSSLTSAACLASGPTANFVGSGTACNTPGNGATPCCFADFNGDGSVGVQDIFDFLAAYFAGDATANINADASVAVQDIFDFLAAYFAGC